MDQEAIQKLAAEIVRNMPNYPLWLSALQVILVLVAAAAGVFLGEYFRTRGRNFATKADFETLLEQLRTNTKLVETIKSEVGQRDWASREWATLRRVKLEELLAKTADFDAYLDKFRSKAIEGNLYEERRPDADMITLMSLYFPELEREVTNCRECFMKQVQLGHQVTVDMMQLNQIQPFDFEKQKAIGDKYRNDLTPLWGEANNAKGRLNAAAAALVQQIMGNGPEEMSPKHPAGPPMTLGGHARAAQARPLHPMGCPIRCRQRTVQAGL